MKPVISNVLLGGLGNQLFQIATVLNYARKNNANYILGIIPINCIKYPFSDTDISEWGGHPVDHPIQDIRTLGDIFPKLNWTTTPKKYKQLIVNDFWLTNLNVTGMFVPLENNVSIPSRVLGYFFSHKYWHDSRDYLLDVFEPCDKIKEYIGDKYGKLFENQTISVHLRLGHNGDPAGENNWVSMNQNLPDYYIKSFSKFDTPHTVLIFSDNVSKASNYKKFFEKKFPDNTYHIIDENVYITLIMMTMCNNYILHNSTLSFWGAYLGKNQPTCKTFLNRNFFRNHPLEIIPADYNWVII